MRRALLVTTGLLLAASAGSAAPQAAERPAGAAPHAAAAPDREAIAALEARLDEAVDRVSLPHTFSLLGREAARGYRLPGYGVVFVLTPRALPGAAGDVLFRFGTPRHRPLHRPRHEASPPGGEAQTIETIERHVVVLQSATEEARRAAEEDMDRMVHVARMRHAGPEDVGGEPAAPPAAPETPGAPGAPAAPGLRPPPPPWKFWFEHAVPRDERTPEQLVADVRQALVEALDGPNALAPGLRPEEFVTIAVAFEKPDPFAAQAGPARTLLVRARAADIAARASGALVSAEFRRRLELIEY